MARVATVYTLGHGFRTVADDPVVTQAVYSGIRRVPLFHDGVDANFKNPKGLAPASRLRRVLDGGARD